MPYSFLEVFLHQFSSTLIFINTYTPGANIALPSLSYYIIPWRGCEMKRVALWAVGAHYRALVSFFISLLLIVLLYPGRSYGDPMSAASFSNDLQIIAGAGVTMHKMGYHWLYTEGYNASVTAEDNDHYTFSTSAIAGLAPYYRNENSYARITQDYKVSGDGYIVLSCEYTLEAKVTDIINNKIEPRPEARAFIALGFGDFYPIDSFDILVPGESVVTKLYTKQIQVHNNEFLRLRLYAGSYATIPEPSCLLLLGIGLPCLAWLRRR